MIISIDGGAPFKALNSVKIMISDDDNGGLDEGPELHVTVSHEGVIYDRVNDGEITATLCVLTGDILSEDEQCCTCGIYLDGNEPDEDRVGAQCAHCTEGADARPSPEVEAAVRASSMRAPKE